MPYKFEFICITMTNPKHNAAIGAMDYVQDGMVIGLGTGSTTAYFLELLGKKIHNEKLHIQGIPTSFDALQLAKKYNIPITSLDVVKHIDLAVDGADAIDPDLNLIKGRGAAMFREKVIDFMAKTFIVLGDESKLVINLAEKPVPIEIVPFALNPAMIKLKKITKEIHIRMGKNKDGPVITDNGNFVIDAVFESIDNPQELCQKINNIPGILENGIFAQHTSKVIIGEENGFNTITP